MTTLWIVHSYIQFTIGFWFSENIEKSSYLGNKFINLLYSCNLHSFSLFVGLMTSTFLLSSVMFSLVVLLLYYVVLSLYLHLIGSPLAIILSWSSRPYFSKRLPSQYKPTPNYCYNNLLYTLSITSWYNFILFPYCYNIQ